MFLSFLPDFNKFEFPQNIIENTQISNFMKTLPVEVDRHMMKLIIAFGNFAKAPQQTVVNSVVLACFKDSLPHSGIDDEDKPWLEHQDFLRNCEFAEPSE